MTLKTGLSYHDEMRLQDVFDLYEGKLRQVEAKIQEFFQNRVPVIPLIGKYITSSGGKRIRPLLHLVSADMCGYKGDATIAVGGIIESIHTASLLHDDVVDMAQIRRGRPSANSLWGNQVVILVGDYLYSNALRVAVMLESQRIMETLSAATTHMTEGELHQLNKIGDPELTEAEYIEIISAKTGALISAACRIGAILGGMSREHEEALADFGMKTGVVFQMADDILDYMAEEDQLGKKLCKDLEEGKITLPLIHLFQVASDDLRNEIKEILAGDLADSGLKRILELLKIHRSIEASFEKASALIAEAKERLMVFPESQARAALFRIADHSLHRGK